MSEPSGYPPLTESAMPWHQTAWQELVGQAVQQAIPHALMFSGVRGIGKRAFAEAFARALLCDVPTPSGSCGACKSCRLLAAGSHPDVRLIAPEDSRVIRIEQIRQMVDFVMRSPQVAHRKVVVLQRADQLNVNAANALLKTLEEPPADVVLLLVHRQGSSLLPTIRSRCQLRTLAVPANAEAHRWLRAQIGSDHADDALTQCLQWAGGAPLWAQQLLEGDWDRYQRESFDAMRGWLKGELPLSEAVRTFVARGLDNALDLLSAWCWELGRMAAGGACRHPLMADMFAYLVRANHPVALHALGDELMALRKSMTNNLSPELALEHHLAAWRRLMPRRQRAPSAGDMRSGR